VKIIIELQPDDPEDAVDDDPTGLTNAAYERLVGAVVSAGFSIVDVRGEWE